MYMRKLIAHFGGALAVVFLAASMGLAGTSGAAAATHNHSASNAISHAAECLQLLITDPAKHDRLCGTGTHHVTFVTGEAGGLSHGVHDGGYTPTADHCKPHCYRPPHCCHPCREKNLQ